MLKEKARFMRSPGITIIIDILYTVLSSGNVQ